MPNEHFERIRAGLEDAVAYMKGDETRGTAYTVPVLNIKELRSQLGLTQDQLARIIGASLPTVAAWEQETNSRYPSGPTQKLLHLLQQRPELIHELRQMPH